MNESCFDDFKKGIIVLCAAFFLVSCSKKDVKEVERVFFAKRDCILVKITTDHPHSKVTDSNYVIRDVSGIPEAVNEIKIPDDYVIQGDLDVRSNDEDVRLPQGSRFRVISKIVFHQAGVGDFSFYKCIHIQSGKKCFYELGEYDVTEELLQIEK